MKTSLLPVCLLVLLPLALRGAEPAQAEVSPPPPPPDEHFSFSDLLPRPFQKDPRINLSIVTEVTKLGKTIPAPTRDKPAYYTILDGGLAEAGDVVGGNTPPPPAKLAQIMEASLAASGYRKASGKNPPTLVIYYQWGSFNRLRAADQSDAATPSGGGIGDLSDPAQVRNLAARAALVGGTKFMLDFMEVLDSQSLRTLGTFQGRDRQSGQLVAMTTSDLYFLLAMAFDYNSVQRGERKLLWSTKVSTDSQGLAMDDTLPAIVTRAASYFGHDTKGPVLFHPHLLDGRVDIGEATVQGYIENPPPAKKP